jgi:hypothetical protein
MAFQLTLKWYGLTAYFYFLSLLGVKLEATNLCGGNIGYQFEGGLTYAFEGTIWVCDQLDTLHVNFYFGDGGMEQVSIPVETTTEGIYVAEFNMEHTFSSAGQYTVYIREGSLPNGLCNVPNSGDESMSIYTGLTISPFYGSNVTPTLSPVWDINIIDGWLVHNLQAADADGDSLSYTLVSPGIPGFTYPNGLQLTANGEIQYFPSMECEILALVQISEWRNGLAIQSVVRSVVLSISSTAIHTFVSPSRTSLYPNPTTSTTTLTWQGQTRGNYQLELYDVHGRLLLSETFPSGQGSTQIDMSAYAKGIYFGRLVVGEEMRSFKVVRE